MEGIINSAMLIASVGVIVWAAYAFRDCLRRD